MPVCELYISSAVIIAEGGASKPLERGRELEETVDREDRERERDREWQKKREPEREKEEGYWKTVVYRINKNMV